MYRKTFTHLSKILVLLFLFFSSHFSFAESYSSFTITENLATESFFLSPPDTAKCGPRSNSNKAKVTLTNIPPIDIYDAANSSEAEAAYKRELAEAADSNGLAVCSGTCTIGDCNMTFKKYASGNSTPGHTTSNGVFTFSAPPNGKLSFFIHCPCGASAQIDTFIIDGHPIDFIDFEAHHLAAEEGHDHSAYRFYPNPASAQISLDLDLKSEAKNLSIHIRNIQGQVVLTQNLGLLDKGQHRFHFEVQDLASGIYLGSIQAGQNTIARSRIVIQR